MRLAKLGPFQEGKAPNRILRDLSPFPSPLSVCLAKLGRDRQQLQADHKPLLGADAKGGRREIGRPVVEQQHRDDRAQVMDPPGTGQAHPPDLARPTSTNPQALQGLSPHPGRGVTAGVEFGGSWRALEGVI